MSLPTDPDVLRRVFAEASTLLDESGPVRRAAVVARAMFEDGADPATIKDAIEDVLRLAGEVAFQAMALSHLPPDVVACYAKANEALAEYCRLRLEPDRFDEQAVERLARRLPVALGVWALLGDAVRQLQFAAATALEAIDRPWVECRQRDMIYFLEHVGETIGPRAGLMERMIESRQIEGHQTGRYRWRIRFVDRDRHAIFVGWLRPGE